MRRSITVYLLSLAAVVAAVVLRWLLDPILGDELALVTLFGYVAGAVWLGGTRPALVVAILGYLACAYFFIEPRHSFDKFEPRHLVGLLTYLATCSIIIGFGEAMRRGQQRAEVEQETLRVMLASIGDAVIATDTAGNVTLVNPVAERLTGWTHREAVGKPLEEVFRIINEESRRPVESPALRALRDGVIVELANHTILIRKDGREVAIDDSAAPIRNANNRILGCVLIFRDISNRRHEEKHLARELSASRFLAAIVESSEDAIITKSLDGIIQTWNDSARRLFGYAADEIVGKHITTIIPPDRIAEEQLITSQLRQGKRIEHFETVRMRNDGQFRHISLTISPIIDHDGTIIGASKIARDITDRKEVEERVYKLMADLKESDRRKDEFLAMLAHELRGPLAPLRNMLELMKRADGNLELLDEARGTMERQMSQLVHLVDDLIDISRISRNKIDLRKERIELASIIHQVVEASRPLAEEANHLVTVQLPEAPVYLHADPVRLAQIFGNLLNNACKYTPSAGNISVIAERQGSDISVKVKDDGLGIPADRLDSVFEMFTQVARTLEWSQGGLGIGLTLVKRLVELHDGTVSARSEGSGKGSEFEVRLPLLIEPIGSEPTESPPAASMPESLPARLVLVVDDNVDAANSLAMLLRISGHKTILAHDGLQAVKAAEEHLPDIVLMDLGLPELNGYEAGRRIRHQVGKPMLIIALTGWGQEEDRRKSKEAGFDGHLVKPVNFDSLMKLLAEHEPSQS